MMDEVINVRLTKNQCMNLAEFIDLYLIDAIRNDTEIDNLEWIKRMIFAKEELERAYMQA